jgi:hypothetical protein
MPQLILIGFTVLVVTALLLISGHSQTRSANGVLWIRYGAPLRMVGALGLAMPIYVIADNLHAARPLTALIIGVVFTAIGLPVFLLAYFWRVGYDLTGIYCVSPWRKNRFVSWANVTDVSFSTPMKQWIIHSAQCGTVRLNVLVPGSAQLIDELARRGVKVDASPMRPR